MTTRTKLFLTTGAAAILLGTAGLATHALAATNSNSTSPIDSLVEKIATKFSLNKDEVQAVFDQDKTERQAEMTTKMKARAEERLTQAVTDGKITQAQKDLITAKMSEVETKLKDVEAITDKEDQRAALDQLRADVSKWAADNNLDSRYVQFLGGPGMGGGRAHHGKPGFDGELPPDMPDDTSTSSSTSSN